MKATTLINCKKANLKLLGCTDLEDWLNKSSNHIYIGRDMSFYVKGAKKSKWFNPFNVKKYGREKCLELYRDYILCTDELLNSLDELKGKTLGCWCYPEKCHGNILIELIHESAIKN